MFVFALSLARLHLIMYVLFSGTFLSLQDKEKNDEFIQS